MSSNQDPPLSDNGKHPAPTRLSPKERLVQPDAGQYSNNRSYSDGNDVEAAPGLAKVRMADEMERSRSGLLRRWENNPDSCPECEHDFCLAHLTSPIEFQPGSASSGSRGPFSTPGAIRPNLLDDEEPPKTARSAATLEKKIPRKAGTR
ncbi:hypothetical protein BDV59DRAFT_154562 [Aspergillus ambiguus]|uniref:uncharacterized protein n=1 Tax=Aspergillus ambiguus TaxID=176160 RepID=UPI003CCE1111